MGRIAKILSFARAIRSGGARISELIINPGGRADVTAEHFSSPGDDSHPLNTDYAFAADTPRSGRSAVLGYVDPINDPKAQPGDKRIIGRDSSSGLAVVEVWLKNDGSAVMKNEIATFEIESTGVISGTNENGFFKLHTNGDFEVNGAIIDAVGNIASPGQVAAATSLTVNNKEMAGHLHPQGVDSDNNTQQNTGGPL